ncbi:MAG: hypothetical protein HY934_11075, partial [Candidatus Firestonebacteria bacterium]|nr:hypothetical protein [Candidatus Firestonebacteria bacterium]
MHIIFINLFQKHNNEIVRKASDLIENNNHLVLHGIGGAGKSTMAIYLSKFFKPKFTNILFFNFKDDFITKPDILCDEIINLLRRKELIGLSEYKNIFEQIKNLPERESVFKKWNFIEKKLKENTLLILDNLEDIMQDEKGIIKQEWKELISEILKQKNIFTIFTTRLKLYLTERHPLENILEIEEYTGPEINFLFKNLNKEKQKYLEAKYKQIIDKFGFHPLSITKAIEQKFDNLERLFNIQDFKNQFEFYRKYFNTYKKDTQKLFFIKYPFSNKFMEGIFSADFISLIKNKLLILKKYNEYFLPYRIINS